MIVLYLGWIVQQVLEQFIIEQCRIGSILCRGLQIGCAHVGLGQACVVQDPAVAIYRHGFQQWMDQLVAQPSGDMPDIAIQGDVEIAPVTTEEFIPPYPGEDDLDGLAGQFRNQVGDQEGGIGQGFVELGDEFREEFGDIRGDDDLVMIGLVVLREAAGAVQFVVLLVAFAEADAVGADRIGAQFMHHVDDAAGVYAAGEEGAQRHIGDHLVVHCALEQLVEFFGDGLFAGCELVGIG